MTDLGNGKVRVRVGDLVEDAYSYLYHHMERPRPVIVGANDLTPDGVTLSVEPSDEVNVTDRLERGHEILLVTKKDDTVVPPELTVIRRYESTPGEQAAPTGTAMLKNPRWKRYDVWRALLQGLRGSVWSALPFSVDETYTLDARVIPLPDDTLGVARVGYFHDEYWGTRFVDDWEFRQDVNGKPALEVHNVLLDRTSQVQVRRKVAYPMWTSAAGGTVATLTNRMADENFYVDLWRGTEDIASLYAAAYRLSGREYARSDITAMEAWSSDAAQRYNMNLRAVQTLWQQFYTRVDEARRDHPMDVRRPYKRRHRVSHGRGVGGSW